MNHNSAFSNLSNKDKVDFYIAMAVIVLAGVFILYFTFPIQQTNKTTQNILLDDNSQSIEEVIIDDAVFVPVTNEFLQRTKIAQVEKIQSALLPDSIVSNKRSALDHTYYDVDSTNQNKITESAEVNIEDASGIDTSINNLKSTTLKTDTLKQVKIVDSLLKDNIAVSKIKDSPVKTKVDETSCIVVIGAFSKEKSKKNLLYRLERDNYKIFKTPYKSLTRIGVYLPCNKQTIEKELIKIRKEYAKDAMLLRKEN